MADHFLISPSEVYVVKPTAETALTTTGGGASEKRNRKSGKSTSKKSKSSNDNDSESNNSKPKLNPKPKPTSRPALSSENDSSVIHEPLPAPTTATPSAKGLSPTMTTAISTTASAATTSKIPLLVPLRFAAAFLPLLSSEDVIRGKGDCLRYVEAGTRSLIQYLAPQLEL